MDTPESIQAIPARRDDMLGLAMPKQHKAGKVNRLRVLLLHHRRLHLQVGPQAHLLPGPATALPARRLVGTVAAAAVAERPNPVKRRNCLFNLEIVQ